MKIFYDPKVQEVCEDEGLAIRKLGKEIANSLFLRLQQLASVKSLWEMRGLNSANCHELKADRAGQLAVYLKHPRRLIFEVADYPVPKLKDGGLDWKNIRSIRILEITDYH